MRKATSCKAQKQSAFRTMRGIDYRRKRDK